jgi:hypothetical protein
MHGTILRFPVASDGGFGMRLRGICRYSRNHLKPFTGRTMPRTWITRTLPALLLACLQGRPETVYAQPPGTIDAGVFSPPDNGQTLPAGWRPLTFSGIERHTVYTLVEDGGSAVVKAVSDRSASGLTRAIAIDPAEYPVIQWRWKVNNILQKGDVTSKDGDDYPARIYITFAFDPDTAGYLERLQQQAARLVYGRETPYRAISYIWGSNTPAGTMIENPYTDRTMMFVVQSGAGKLQQWVTERRNVYADYQQAFGEKPTSISGIAIMTDTDNTRESATAWYGDIVFLNNPGAADQGPGDQIPDSSRER